MKSISTWNVTIGVLSIGIFLAACGQSATQSVPNAQVTNADQAVWERLTQEAQTAQQQGDQTKAENSYKAAIAEAEKIGFENPAQARAIANLADFYYVQGDGAQADQLYRRSLAMQEKALGTEHVDLVQNLIGLARLSTSQKKYEKASEFYARALAILKVAGKPIPADLTADYTKAKAQAAGQG